MTVTADSFITKVLRRCFWPGTNAKLSNTEILGIADEEIEGDFRQEAILLGGGWYYAEQDYAITSGQPLYRLPDRLFGRVIDVVRVDSSGEEISIPTLSTQELGHYPGTSRRRYDHLLQGDFVRLYPTPATTQDTLRVKYYRAPNALTLSANALPVTAIDLDNDQLTFGSDPDTPFNTGDEVDVISSGNAHQALTFENAIQAFPGGNVATLETGSLAGTGIAIGDWMSAEGTTPIVPVPDEMMTALVKRVASECLRAAGEAEAARYEENKADEAWGTVQSLLRDRSEAEPKVIITHNSPLRSRMRFGTYR